MLAGLLWSRALLSISHVLIAILSIIGWAQLKTVVTQPLIVWSCVPLLLFFVGAYQQPANLQQYDYLLTLCMYPIAAIAGYRFISFNPKLATYILLVAGAVSLLYPVGWYLSHMADVHVAYGRGQSLPTFLEGDHVRYGIFLNSLLLLVSVSKEFRPAMRNSLLLVLVFIIVLMAVRTAWVALGIIVICGCFYKQTTAYKLFRKLVLLAVPLCMMAYLLVPTVRQKINYTLYDYMQYTRQQDHSNFSDGTRRIINKAARLSIQQQPTRGIGWSAIPTSLQETFTQHFPAEKLQFFWPFNQYLFWWMGAGLVGMLLFSSWLFWPVWYALKTTNQPLLTWTLVIGTSCLVESTLSLQYGAFLHAWPMALLWSKQHSKDKIDTREPA